MFETLSTIVSALPYILVGSFATMAIVCCALALGFMLGVPLAVAQVYGGPPGRWLVGFYVWIFRGTPILVLLYLFYFTLSDFVGYNLPAFWEGCLVLGLASAAYQSQIFRGSILSLPQGQLKAARALGMRDITGITTVILPQALRLSIPGWTNEFSILLKDSTLVFMLGGAPELMARSHFVASRTYEYLAFYALAGVLYFCITLIGLKALRFLERKVHIPGYALAQ